MPNLDSPVRGHSTLEDALEAIFDKLDKLDKLDDYVRNHLTTKMEAGFDEVKNGLERP